jgi:hypothetical protein
MDGAERGEVPMAASMQAPSTNGLTNGNGNGSGVPPSGLPTEQLYTWLEWVQDDLRRIETRLEFLEAARSKLREQERLLGELLVATSPVS